MDGEHLDGGRLDDGEVVYRRIPRSNPWFEEPDCITSVNFKLDHREKELGVSVYRKAVVSGAEVLAKPGAIAGSFLVQATVGEIRSLKSGKGDALKLDVIVVDDEQDPGHAEIRGPIAGEMSNSAAKALKKLFKPG